MNQNQEYYFYKAVTQYHIRGISLIPAEQALMNGGIKVRGLDPNLRNLGGGATSLALAASGRNMNEADKTKFGQCLTGSQHYAETYCKTDEHVLLRVTLLDLDLAKLVVDSRSYDDFYNMHSAVNCKECTAIEIITADKISYLHKNGTWHPISQFASGLAKNFIDDDSDDDDIGDFD